MRAATIPFASERDQLGWLEWLRRELAPFPGRTATTVRLVVAVVLVTIISMSLQVPELALSAYMVLFITKENRVLTGLTGVLLALGVTLGLGLSLFLYRYTFDFPALRVVTMAAVVFAGMYLSRVFVIGPLGFAIGFVVAITQSVVDGAPTPEIVVRAVLWLWVIIVYPIALTVVINQILLPAHPHTALIRALVRRLEAATTALERIVESGMTGGNENAALLDLATRGSAPLRKLLGLAERKSAWLQERHASHVAAIAASEQIATAAAALELREREPLAEGDRDCAQALIEEIASLRAAVQSRHAIQTSAAAPCTAGTLLELRELQLAIASLRESLAGGRALPATSPTKVRKPLFVADALSNPAHARFALKVTLAAMACYLIYTGLNWPGIRTAFITCCFVALESTGASLRKAWLRLGGCIIGGMLGFLSLMYLVPHMETIISLALLTAAVTALAGWVAAGSERIAYAGLQIGFAFYLSIFQGFAPDTDFAVIRDRVVGIVLGIFVLSLVFRYLWPERAVDRLRAAIAMALRNLSRLVAIPRLRTASKASVDEGARLRDEISSNLDTVIRAGDAARFEIEETGVPTSLRVRTAEALVSRTQNLYLTAAMLTGESALAEWQRLSDPAKVRDSELRGAIAAGLTDTAARIENGTGIAPANLDAPPSALTRAVADVPEESPKGGRADLLRRLIVQAQAVA